MTDHPHRCQHSHNSSISDHAPHSQLCTRGRLCGHPRPARCHLEPSSKLIRQFVSPPRARPPSTAHQPWQKMPPQKLNNEEVASSGTYGAPEAHTDPGATSCAARACERRLCERLWLPPATTGKQAAEASPHGLRFASSALAFGYTPSQIIGGGTLGTRALAATSAMALRGRQDRRRHGLIDL